MRWSAAPFYNKVTECVNRKFPARWLGHGVRNQFVASSVSGSQFLYFILCDFVKSKVYIPPITVTLNDLKDQTGAATVKN